MLKKTLLVVGAVLLTLLALEWGLRVYIDNFGREDQKIRYLYGRDDLNRLAERHRGLPYLNYGLSPGHPQHNAQGFRGPDISIPKADDTFRIVALGGSTTYGSGNERWQDAYPAQLERVLHSEYDQTRVEVVNAGVINYTSWETLANISFRMSDLQPDLLIVYHAMNDIQPRLIHPEDYNGLNLYRGLWQADAGPVPASTLFRFVALRLGWSVRYDDFGRQFQRVDGVRTCGGVYERDGRYICNNFDMAIDDLLAANPPTYFERNLRTMIAVAQAQGIPLMFASWAYSDLLYPLDVGGDYMTYAHNQGAVAQHNAITQRVAIASGVPFYDFAADMPNDAAYWVDGMHVNTRGARLQAERFAAFIVDVGLL
jgi:lysophospholipase L1-like esterase